MKQISSRENPAVKQVSRLLKSKRERDEQGLFVLEGRKICLEAFSERIQVQSVFMTGSFLEQHGDLADYLERKGEMVYQISEDLEARLSDCKTPQGIFCVCKKLDKLLTEDTIYSKRLLLMLCGIQDPGNLGTLIRTADALGMEGVLLADGCCDVYSPKVIRSTMGSLFRMPLMILPDSAAFLKKQGERICSAAAVVDLQACPAQSWRLAEDRPNLLCIGNEGRGLSEETVRACTVPVTIRMKGHAESLNAAVAAAILMWEMQKD